MKYVAYGSEPESVKVMADSETVHIRMARNYQPPNPNDDQSTGQWEETYQQIDSASAPTLEQIEADADTWWNRGVDWATAKAETLEDRVSDIEALVKGTPSYGELLEAVNILLGE